MYSDCNQRCNKVDVMAISFHNPDRYSLEKCRVSVFKSVKKSFKGKKSKIKYMKIKQKYRKKKIHLPVTQKSFRK